MAILATDNFTRADNADLGTAWDECTGESAPGGFNISANTAIPSDVNSDSSETNNSVTWPDRQYSEVTFGTTAANGAGVGSGPTCRAATGATVTNYRVVGNASGYEVIRFNAGTPTVFRTSTGTTFAVGDKLRLEIITSGANAIWTVKKNGVVFDSGIDTSPIASGRAGIGFSSVATVASLTAWEGGSIDPDYWPILSNAHPGLSPGVGDGSARFTASNWWPYTTPAADATVIINEGLGAFNWSGVQSNLTKILTENVGAYTWAGTQSQVPRLVKAVPGAYTWSGTNSPISKSIAALKGTYSWAGTQSPLSKMLNAISGAYTWAGVHATLESPTTFNAAPGAYSWAGRTSSFATLVQQSVGRWTWAGTHANVTTPSTGAVTHYYPVPGRRRRR